MPAPPWEVGPLAETLDESRNRVLAEEHADQELLPVLILLWCRGEPDRAGEAVYVPTADGEAYGLGRAVDVDADGVVPLRLGRLRPHGRIDTGPLRSPHVSRRQLTLALAPDGDLRVEQVGSSALRLDGHSMASGVLRPGGLIEVENRLALLYTHRPAAWLRAGTARVDADFAFGTADAWGLVGESPAAWELRRQAALLAADDEHVLVVGPSGSGKELVVQAIHGQSRRARAALVARNAATLPESLIDAELFGNLRNYPNPGMPERAGLLGEADGGALFLDEIGELPPRMQAHLLRVMDRGEYQRLGESTTRRADLRVLAATNRDPAELKHDFLARFPQRLAVPGLGDRPEDVPLVAAHLLRAIAPDAPHPGLELTVRLVGHRFTTHVRELRELLWRALRVESGDVHSLAIPPGLARVARPRPADIEPGTPPAALTREAVQAVLARCGGVREAAWRELGLRNRFQLHRVLKKLGLE